MSMDNMLIFREPINYLNGRVTEHGASTVIHTMTDNSYQTSSSETDIDINMADTDGNPTKIDYIFIKFTGDLVDWQFTPSGGSGTDVTRTVPDEITNYAGETVSLQVDGFKHDLYLMTADQTATSVRMRFTGTNVQIVAILLLELLQEIDANASEILAVDARQVDRTGRIDTSPIGRVERFSKNVRKKQAVELSIKVVPGETLITDIDEFVFMLEDHTHIVLAEAFSERPELVYPRYYFINPNTGSLSIGLQAALERHGLCGGCLDYWSSKLDTDRKFSLSMVNGNGLIGDMVG